MDKSLAEIELAINALTPRQREELCEWLDCRYPQAIDERLTVDLAAGRFDDRIAQALADHKKGKTTLLSWGWSQYCSVKIRLGFGR